jgi:hypothetical protein
VNVAAHTMPLHPGTAAQTDTGTGQRPATAVLFDPIAKHLAEAGMRDKPHCAVNADR